MTNPCSARLRRDLRVHTQPGGAIEIVTPQGERYAFDPQSFALLQLFDGQRDCQSIAAAFNARFDTQLAVEEIERFLEEAFANGLVEYLPASGLANRQSASDRQQSESDSEETDEDERWVLFDPMPLFSWLSHRVAPWRLPFQGLTLSLGVLVPLAFYTLFENQILMEQDLAKLQQVSSYFWRLLLSLFVINLARCLIQGILIAYYGGKSQAFGIRLRFGVIPRFFIDRHAVLDLKREARLWIWGSNLVLRLVLIAGGTLGWFIWRTSHLNLALHALILAHAGLIGLILVSLPVRNSDGYRWLMTWRGLPLTTLKLAGYVLYARLRNQPLPTSISRGQAQRLVLYALALGAFWAFAFWRIFTHITQGLNASFPQLFGEATQALIALLVALLMLRWGWQRLERLGWITPEPNISNQGLLKGSQDPAPGGGAAFPESEATASKTAIPGGQATRLIALGLLGLILILPFPYRPGGPVTLLAPEQQAIQAPVSGRIIRVLQRGGDGALLAAGETVALILADTVEQQIKELSEQIQEQQAILAQRRAELALKIAGSRPELVAEARARLEQAQEEVWIAEQQLTIARVTASYSARELDRIRDLPKGVLSEVEITRIEKQAAIDRLRIPEQERVVEAKRKSLLESEAELALLLNGPQPEEIEIAQQGVAASQANLRRLEQALAYTQSQLAGTQLRMPFAGYLVEGHLQQKEGIYLTQGDHFATAQARRRPLVELVLPESEVSELPVGAPAEIRLQTYPERPLAGQLLAIEPTGTPSLTGQTFRLLIELAAEDRLLTPGMSGYGKVTSGTKPLYLQLARPLIRFFAIEVWSWLP